MMRALRTMIASRSLAFVGLVGLVGCDGEGDELGHASVEDDEGEAEAEAAARSGDPIEPSAADLDEKASLLMPAGLHGPAFLILPNYYVIKAYNFSDLYVLFVGNVADRIAGGKAFATPWKKVVQLHTRDLEEMQKRLAELGLYKDKIDGKAGMRTRLALGAYQKANGLHADCWPDAEVLTHMRSRSARN